MNQNKVLIAVAIVALALLIGASSLYAVNEREQTVVARFGEILRIDDVPGLHWKLPLIDRAQPFSLRLLNLDEEAQPVRTSDDKELVVDLFVKWRIVDVRQYYLSIGAQEGAAKILLHQAVARHLGDEFGKRTLKGVTAADWRQLTETMTAAADKETRKSGVEVVDVHLLRIGVPANQTVFDRMHTERLRIAKERREQGAEAAEKIRTEGERARDQIAAEGYAKAERLRGEGDARAAAIHANAAAVAPEFYSFYQSLSAYKEIFKKKEDVMVMDPSSDFFKYMKKPSR